MGSAMQRARSRDACACLSHMAEAGALLGVRYWVESSANGRVARYVVESSARRGDGAGWRAAA